MNFKGGDVIILKERADHLLFQDGQRVLLVRGPQHKCKILGPSTLGTDEERTWGASYVYYEKIGEIQDISEELLRALNSPKEQFEFALDILKNQQHEKI
mgnify:CR=1 FL=1